MREPAAARQSGETDTVLRLCLDANVWVAFLFGEAHGRSRTAAAQLVAAVRSRAFGHHPLQLVLSHELLDTIERVLLRLGVDAPAAADFRNGLTALTRKGPEQLDPHLLVSGRDQLAMVDREDAGVLAMCFAARADLLVTDNLKDFETNDSRRIDTQIVQYRSGNTRRLYAILHERADGAKFVVLHPFDAVDWLKRDIPPTPEAVISRYRSV